MSSLSTTTNTTAFSDHHLNNNSSKHLSPSPVPIASLLSTASATSAIATASTEAKMVSAPDATHSRKSRLTVPSGSPDVQLAATATGGGTPAAGGALRPNGASTSSNNNNRHAQYVARLMDVRQMDVQSALDQMRTLLSTRPHVVYKTSYYRKQTKNHWARDDPAFCVLQVLFLVIASIAYAVAFRSTLTGAIAFLLQSVLWNWLICGVILATLGRELANRHLTVHQSSSHVRQSVEWLYAFDIHCNAFVPLFFLLYGVQFFLLPLVLGKSLVALLIANTLYAAAFSWYWYITHLGYRTLPFLSNTEVFLFPIAAIVLIFLLNLIGYLFGFGWNASRLLAHLFFDE